MIESWSGVLGSTESGVFLYNVAVGDLNLQWLTLGQRGRMETICSRLRNIDRGDETKEVNRALQDIRILLDIMGASTDF